MQQLELGATAGVQQVRRLAPDAGGTHRARWRRMPTSTPDPLPLSARVRAAHAARMQAAPQSKVDQRLNHAVGLDVRGYSTAGRDQKRTGHGGGFREFDDEEDNDRKRRAVEAHAEKQERKAEKKKCEFWCARRPHLEPTHDLASTPTL